MIGSTSNVFQIDLIFGSAHQRWKLMQHIWSVKIFILFNILNIAFWSIVSLFQVLGVPDQYKVLLFMSIFIWHWWTSFEWTLIFYTLVGVAILLCPAYEEQLISDSWSTSRINFVTTEIKWISFRVFCFKNFNLQFSLIKNKVSIGRPDGKDTLRIRTNSLKV